MMNDEYSQEGRRHKPRWILATLGFVIVWGILELSVILAKTALLTVYNPTTSAFIQNYLKTCSWKDPSCPFQQIWKPLDKISYHLQEAVLIAEDDTFFEHEGIDAEAIRESIELNLKKKRFVRGGSTLTQQLVKNLYLSSSKNPFRKLKEMLLALCVEKILSKPRILEIYLNLIEWGKGIYGAEAASQFYFKKPAFHLSAEEAAYLAAIIPNPIWYTEPSHSKRAQRRKVIILKRMGVRNFQQLSSL